MKLDLLLLSSLTAGALAIPASVNHVLHEKRDVNNEAWSKGAAVESNTRIPVRIALKQRNIENGMDYLMKVSDPNSPEYGNHYSAEKVANLFAPSQETVDTVTKWLVSSGIPKNSIKIPKSQGWVSFETTASKLESLLDTKYHMYKHAEDNGQFLGTDQYKLPTQVANHIDFVTPGVAFSAKKRIVRPMPNPRPMPAALASSEVEDCGKKITPDCIRKMYNVPRGKTATKGNELGIFEWRSDTYAQEDFDQFFKEYANYVPKGSKPKLLSVNGATAPTTPDNASGEADLDFEIAMPLIYPQSTLLYQVNSHNMSDGSDLFDSFLDAVDGSYCSTDSGDCGTYEPATVISFSWGATEADWPTKYLQRQCSEYMKLGLRGSTLVFASGDDGVARRSGPCLGKNKNIFVPDAQSSCPYVTAVGSTVLPDGSQPGDDETATVSFSSGGGFSNIHSTPDYQKDIVAGYLADQNPGYQSYVTRGGAIPDNGGIYNRGGRGYPDLSASGDNGANILDGEEVLAGGTSMSAPLVAGLFTLINEERLKAGKKVIGFVNPTLYQHPEMFNDITVGNQDKGGPAGDGGKSSCGNDGFSAVQGWDPVSGLGTPKYDKMLKVFMSV